MKVSFGKLLGLFIIVPFIELYILLKLADITSPFITFAIIIATGALGAYFARQQGRAVLRDINTEIGSGNMPTDILINGLCVLIGGILLLTPGILTDGVGFLLILPVTRTVFVGFVKRHCSQLISSGHVHIRANINSNAYERSTNFNRAGDDEDIVIVDEYPKDTKNLPK